MRPLTLILVATLLPAFAAFAAPSSSRAQATGSITVRNLACPPGYSGDRHADDCGDNPVAGTTFAISEPKSSYFVSAITDAGGRATLALPDIIASGTITFGQTPPVEVLDEQPPFVVTCTKSGGEAVDVQYSQIQLDPGGDAFSVAVAAVPGDQIVCDWYDLAPRATSGETPAAPGTIVGTAAPVDEAIVGGLGLSRAEWEAAHGAAEPTDAYAPPYRPVYQYERGIFYVQFAGEGGDADPIIYLELVFPDEGAELPFAEGKVRELLPDDAELSEAFYLPRTPGGPTAQRVFHGTSQVIAAAFPNAPTPNILVVFFERARDPQLVGAGESPDTIVRASLAVRIDAP